MRCCDLAQGIFGDRFVVAEAAIIWRWKGVCVAIVAMTDTVMLTYGGDGRGMGKNGSFNNAKEWFGFKTWLLEDKDKKAEDAFKEMHDISDLLKAAIVDKFPVPEFKPADELPEGEKMPEGTPLGFIEHLDVVMDGPGKASHVEKFMVPTKSGYQEGLNKYYLKGPYTRREDLLAGLEADPMLQAVFHKWSTFEKSVLEAAFSDCTGVYLQIQWMGWYSRPIRELSPDEFENILLCARGPCNLTVNS